MLQTCERRMLLKTNLEVNTTSEVRQLPLQLLSNHLDANELQRSARSVTCISNRIDSSRTSDCWQNAAQACA